MLMESSLHVSTVATTARASVLHSQHPFHIKKNIKKLPTLEGPRFSKSTKSSSFSSSSLSSFVRKNLGYRLVCKASGATDTVQAVTESNWNELVISSDNLVLVDFWAPWCGPCKLIAPIVDELAKEYVGKVQCYKLNTDNCPNLPTQLGIRSIPTVLFFKNGERKESIIGAVPKSTLSATIEKYLDV